MRAAVFLFDRFRSDRYQRRRRRRRPCLFGFPSSLASLCLRFASRVVSCPVQLPVQHFFAFLLETPAKFFFKKKKLQRETRRERERELITSDKQISVEKMLKIAEKIRSSLNRSGETTSCPNTVAVFRCVETSASFLLRNNK